MKEKRLKLAGILFLIGGCAMLASGAFLKQTPNLAIGAAFIAIGAAFIAISKKVTST